MSRDNKNLTFKESVVGFSAEPENKDFKSFLVGEKCCCIIDLKKKNAALPKNLKLEKRIKVIVIAHGSRAESMEILPVISQVGEMLGEDKQKVYEFRLQVCYQGSHIQKREQQQIGEELKKYQSNFGITFSCPMLFSDIKSNPPCDTNATSLEDFQDKKKSKKLEIKKTYTLPVRSFNAPTSSPNNTNVAPLKNDKKSSARWDL